MTEKGIRIGALVKYFRKPGQPLDSIMAEVRALSTQDQLELSAQLPE